MFVVTDDVHACSYNIRMCGTTIQDEPREAVTQVVATTAAAAANDSYHSQTQIQMVTLSNSKR